MRASIQAVLGREREADALYQVALDIHDELGYHHGLVRTRWAYGQFLVRQSERERGIALMAECVAYEQRIGHAQAEEHAALIEHLRTGGELPV
jgi:hypothetical protein